MKRLKKVAIVFIMTGIAFVFLFDSKVENGFTDQSFDLSTAHSQEVEFRGMINCESSVNNCYTCKGVLIGKWSGNTKPCPLGDEIR